MWSRDRRTSPPQGCRAAVYGVLRVEEVAAVRAVQVITRSFTRYRDERGSAMTEYALILALVTIIGMAGLSVVGDASMSLYSGIGDAFEAIFG